MHDDLLDQCEICCLIRVAWPVRMAGIKAQIDYKRRPSIYGGKPSVTVDNTLDRQFDVAATGTAWVTNITYIKTYEGFAYLAVVIDLYSRRVVGWVMQSRKRLIWFYRHCSWLYGVGSPKTQCSIHSDQG